MKIPFLNWDVKFERKGLTTDQQLRLLEETLQAQLNASNPLRMVANAQPIYGAFDKANQINIGYASNAGIYSVQRLIAKTAAMIPMCAYEIKDEKAARQLKNLALNNYSDNYAEDWHKLSKKAYELVPESELQTFVDNINPNLDTQEFLTGVYVYKLSTGNSLIYKAKDLDGKLWALYHLPPEYTSIVATTNVYPKIILGYEYNLNGLREFTLDEIIHLRYFNPKFTSNGDELWGLSPVQVLMKEITQDNEAANSQVAQFQNGGPAAFVGNKGITADQAGVELMGKIKAKWDAEAAGSKNRGKFKLVPGEPVVARVGLSPVDLDILEGRRFTLSQYCNVFGISDILLNNNEASTESNVKEQIKRLYTNAALPEAYSLRNQLNKHVAPQFKSKYKTVLDVDITAIPELQADMLKTAQALAASPLMSPKDVAERLGLNASDLPEDIANKMYIKQGYLPIEDAGLTDMPNDVLGNNLQL